MSEGILSPSAKYLLGRKEEEEEEEEEEGGQDVT